MNLWSRTTCFIPAFIDDSGPYLRVQVGGFNNLNEAAEMERRLKRAGYPTVIVR